MPLPRLISIRAYRADTYTVSAGDEVKPATGTNDLWPYALSYKRTDHLRETSTLTLDLMKGCPWHTEDVLSVRDRLALEYDNGSAIPYRLKTVKLGTGEASGLKIEAWHLASDLQGYLLHVLQDPLTSVLRAKDFDRWRVDDVLATLFDSDYGLPSAFVLGTVEAALAALEVSLYANSSTFSDLLKALSEEVRRHEMTLEYETAYNLATGTLTFNVFRERGWSDVERAAGASNPSSRLIKAPTGTSGDNANRLFNRIEAAQDDYVSRLVPLGGASEEEQIGVGSINWPVASAVFSAGQTVVTFDDDCVAFDAMFAGGTFSLRGQTTSYPIVAAAAPNQITVTGNASAETKLRFISSDGTSINGIGTDVDYVQRPDGEAEAGVVYKSLWLRDIPPYANLFEEAGGSPDMSTWASGLPLGMEKINGAEVITEEMQRLFVLHGTKSAKVQCDAGQGLQTQPINFLPDDLQPYFSAHATVTIEAGRVVMYFLDSEGVRHPLETEPQHEGTVSVTQALAIGGMELALGSGRLVIEAVEDGTVFYLDALSVTQSVGYWPYAERMGPKALFVAAGDYLKAEGGVQPLSVESRFIDMSEFAAGAPSAVGAWCRLQDLRDFEAGAYNLDLTGRIQTLEEGGPGPGRSGTPFRRAKIGRVRPTVAKRFVRRSRRSVRAVSPRRSRITLSHRLHFGLHKWQDGDQGHLRIVPYDPDGRITEVKVHKSVGMPLPEPGSEAWETLALQEGGYYETSVEIHAKHQSWIRYHVELDGGATSPVVENISFDIDTVAHIEDKSLDYKPATRELDISWLADEDTAGVVYAWNKTGQADLDDAAFAAAIAAGQFINGNGRKSVTVPVDLKPGETVHVGWRPFKSALTTGSPATTGNGPDAFESLYLPSTADMPQGYLRVKSKAGGVVTVAFTLTSDPSGLLSSVQARHAIGRDLLDTDTYAAATESSPGVEWTRALDVSNVTKRDSFVQFKLVTLAGVDDLVLPPITVDPDPNPEAHVTLLFQYNPATKKYELGFSWEGDDDLASIAGEETESGDDAFSNNLQGRLWIKTDIAPGDAYRLVVTGYTGAGKTGDSFVLLDTGVLTAPTLAPGVDAGDISFEFNRIHADHIVDGAREFNSDVEFYTDDNDTIRWRGPTAGTGQVYYDGDQEQPIDDGAAALPALGTALFVFFDRAAPSSTLQTTSDYATAVSGSRVILCTAWRATDAAHRASYTPTVGVAGPAPPTVSVDMLAANVVTAVAANIADLAALNINTGSLTVSGNLSWDAGKNGLGPSGMILRAEGSALPNDDPNVIRWKTSGGDNILAIGATDSPYLTFAHPSGDNTTPGIFHQAWIKTPQATGAILQALTHFDDGLTAEVIRTDTHHNFNFTAAAGAPLDGASGNLWAESDGSLNWHAAGFSAIDLTDPGGIVSGTDNVIPKFTATGIEDSLSLYEAASGFVGIGTSDPQTSLHLYTDSHIQVRIEANNAGLAHINLLNTAGSWGLQNTSAGDFRVRDANTNANVLLLENGAPENALYIDASGNVGIGTAGPGETLHVAGSQRWDLSATSDYTLDERANAITLVNADGATQFELFDRTGEGSAGVQFLIYGLGTAADITNRERLFIQWHAGRAQYEIMTNKAGLGSARDLALYTHGQRPQLHLATNGAVGVGTDAPAYPLHVVGNAYTSGVWMAEGTFPGLWMGGSGTKSAYLLLSGDDLTVQRRDAGFGAFEAIVYSMSVLAPANTLVVSGAGKVGIGTANPAFLLDVAGAMRLTNKIRNASGTAAAPTYTFDSDAASGLYSEGLAQVNVSTSGAKRGEFNDNGLEVLGKVFIQEKPSIPSSTAAGFVALQAHTTSSELWGYSDTKGAMGYTWLASGDSFSAGDVLVSQGSSSSARVEASPVNIDSSGDITGARDLDVRTITMSAGGVLWADARINMASSPVLTMEERPSAWGGIPSSGSLYWYNNTLWARWASGTPVDLMAVAGGDVVGPPGATDSALVLFDTSTGKLIKEASGVTYDGTRLTFALNKALRWVDGSAAADFYHDGTQLLLHLYQNFDVIFRYGNNDKMAEFDAGAAVKLFYDGSEKFSTESGGISVTGNAEADKFVTTTTGSASAPPITTQTSTNTGIYFPGGTAVAVTVSGTQFMEINALSNQFFGNRSTYFGTTERIILTPSNLGEHTIKAEINDLVFRLDSTEVLRLDQTGNKVVIANELKVGGDINHDGTKAGFFGVEPISRPTVSVDTLAALRTAIEDLGLIIDAT